MRELRREDAGFTLVEMMIAAVVMAVVVAPLTASVLLGLLTVTQSQSRVTHSTDEALLTSYFTTDVQSSATVATGPFCGGSGAQLVLNWTDPSTSQAFQVAYITEGKSLLRVVCVDGSERRRLEVARSLAAGSPVTFSCALDPPVFSTPCSAAKPRQVKVEVAQVGESFQSDGHEFDLVVTRRRTT